MWSASRLPRRPGLGGATTARAPRSAPNLGSCLPDASPQLRAREITLPPHSPRERERKEGSDPVQQVLGVLARFRKRGRLAGERGESIPWAYFLPRNLST